MTLDEFRSGYGMPERIAYFDYAATGVLSTAVHAVATDFIAGRAGRLPDRSPNNFPADLECIEDARRAAAALLKADVQNVDLMPNTSYGLNVLAQGLDWQPGDRVAVPSCEFPANLLPWKALARRGVELDLIPHADGVFGLDDVQQAMKPRTRVVALSWVQFLSGFRADLAGIGEICRAHDVLFVVDAIQGLGALEIDAPKLGIDLLACGGHKWMCSMQGLGFVYVADSILTQLQPVVGWLNGPVDWNDFEGTTGEFWDDATRFRVGTMPTAQAYALYAALTQWLDVGPAVIEQAALRNAALLWSGLERLGYERYGSLEPQHASGIVTVRAPAPEALYEHLSAQGVVASVRNRLVRFATHAQTRPEDIERGLENVAAFGRTSVSVS